MLAYFLFVKNEKEGYSMYYLHNSYTICSLLNPSRAIIRQSGGNLFSTRLIPRYKFTWLFLRVVVMFPPLAAQTIYNT